MSWLDGDVTTLAFCWRLARRDGVTVGLTSHDRDLTFGGLIYRSAPGMVPSAIEASRSMEPSSVTLDGSITADVLTEDDLAAGLWDGARLTLSAVNWQDPDDAPVFLVRGRLGQVETAGNSFSVDLSGVTQQLDRPVTQTVTPLCRAQLGDARCRVDLRGRRHIGRCTGVEQHDVSIDVPLAEDRFLLGRLRWLTGPHTGQTSVIMAQTGSRLALADTVSASLTGHLAELTEGCDRTLDTCAARFANAANFQGEPHLPGNDLLTRYGG